jgi:uncharacterized protein (DUF2147 family)
MRIERCEAEPQSSRSDKTGMQIGGAGCSRSREGGRLGGQRMLRRSAVLAALMTIGASDISLAREAPYLGDWARSDGKTRIHVASCGAEICARNTWVRHGVSGEKVGDRLILKVKPAGAGHWSGHAFDPQRKQNYAINVHVAAKHMTTKGCVMGGFMCQSMGWTRTN